MRAIQRELQDPLAFMVLSGEFKDDDTIRVERGKEGLVFTSGKPAAAPPDTDLPIIEGEIVE